MGHNRVFFPQTALDQWLSEGKVELTGDELTVKPESRRYRILEAARIVREVAGGPDAAGLVGKVKTLKHLADLGADVLEGSMVLGENAYDVVPGFLASPVGTFEEHVAGGKSGESRSALSDEDLLAKSLLGTF